MNLNQFEKAHRRFFKAVPPPVGKKEIFLTFAVAILTAPFIYAALFMIPLIGQMLFLGAFILTILYLYVRKSFKIFAAVFVGHVLYLVPTVMTLQMVLVKNRFDVALSFLIASCIPVTIFYSMFVAGRTWFLVESNQELIAKS